MGKYSLDQLLEATGVDELAGTPFKKVASNEPDLLKLAERCREAASVEEPAAEAAVSEELVDTRQLVEKTAAVEIIRRTIAEIREIEGTPPEAIKTASTQGPDQAAFIKAALEEGHTPEEIARFLEEAEKDKGPAKKKKKKTATTIVS